MQRPTVLHVARDWVRPSEGFVADVVRTCTATRALVACGRRWPDGPAGDVAVPVATLPPPVDRLPWGPRRQATRAWLAAVALRGRADVLHAHFGYWAPHVAAVARRLGRPWVVSLHGHDLLVEATTDGELLPAVVRADLVVVPSAFLAGAAEAAGIAPERLRVIPSGLDLADLPFRTRAPAPDGTTVVTFAGRFVEKKGVSDAAEAIAEVARTRPHVRPCFVGTGPLEHELRRDLARLGLPAEIRDGAPVGALRATLDETSVLVTPSRTADDGDAETLGLVNLEAQACGVPVVTTRHGGIPEAVAPDGAVLVPEGDVAALARALGDVVDAPERWPAMGRAGRAHVASRFELGARVADLEEQYRALASGRGPVPVREPAYPTPPAVSVVMVTHQRRELVRRSLDALAAQTYPRDRFEVIVVDNGTTDGTSADLAARTDLPLTVVRSETNASTSWARNVAAARGRGEVIAFTDDDCRPRPTWLEALVAGFREGVDLVQGRTVADPALPLEPLSRTQWTPAEYGAYETANIAYRRDAFVAAGGFDEDFAREVASTLGSRLARFPFGEDTDLAWRVKRAGGGSRFAATATVEHHVFPPDPRLLVRRAALAAAFPVLVRRVPELRDAFLWRRLFLGPHHLAVLGAVAGVAGAAAGRPRALVATVPWLWRVLRPTDRGRRPRLAAAPVRAVADTVELAAVAYGSVRARTPVL